MKARKRERIERALIRDAERAKRTPQQQIARLDSLLGAGVGAVRERARLAQQIVSTEKKHGKR